MAAVCASCKDPLVLEIEIPDDADGEMTQTITVPDDVRLPCGENFHWQCLIDSSFEITKCPSCENDISSAPVSNSTPDAKPQVLATVNNEGGLQPDLDLFPILQEESYLKTYPEERQARAFLEFCREGDYHAAAGVLTNDNDEDEDEDEDDSADASSKPALDVAAMLRYQDPLAGEQSALHAAAANGHREVAWLLLLLASELPEIEIPALVYQEAAALGVMRQDQAGTVDIRTLRDAQGRSAEDVARETGDTIWNGWFGTGRLAA
ncbi:hypothetical protein AMS68_004270 [Peltaster fructicola]|uniref:Uncharacterized protein n=1 Tax=Peltaster fructicola TaxID=286661 RepID=A0A6H0XVH9_9PEZI|nr:hypothetical protein AMS68_004270 [Peltaster fructicola]